jgi:hypothetical protein
MTIAEIINIGGPLFVMRDKLTDLVDAFHNKRAELEKVGAAGSIAKELRMDKTAVDALVTNVNANLPFASLLSFIANPIGQYVIAQLDVGLKEWGA